MNKKWTGFRSKTSFSIYKILPGNVPALTAYIPTAYITIFQNLHAKLPTANFLDPVCSCILKI